LKNYNNTPIYELYIHKREHGFGKLGDCRNYIIIVKQKNMEPHAYVRASEPSYNEVYNYGKIYKIYKVGSLRMIEHKLKWEYVFRGYITKETMESMLFIDMI